MKQKRGGAVTPRVSDAEHDKRVADMVDLVLLGLRPSKIFRIIAENERYQWNVSRRQIENYMAEAKEAIKASGAFDRDEETAVAVERYRDLYAKSAMINDYKTCLAIQKELSELIGIKAAQKLEHSGKDGGPLQVTVTVVNKQEGAE